MDAFVIDVNENSFLTYTFESGNTHVPSEPLEATVIDMGVTDIITFD